MRQTMRWMVTGAGALLLLLVFPANRFGGTVQADRSPLASLVHYTLCAPTGRVVGTGEMRLDRQLVQNRLTEGFGIAHSRVTQSGKRCLRVTLPTKKQQKAIVRSVGQAGIIALTDSGHVALHGGTLVRLVCGQSGCLRGASVGTTNATASPPRLRVVVPMRDMSRGSAYLSRDAAGQSTVIYSLTAGGARAWCTFTTRHVDFYSAIVVDDRVLSDPIIQGAICGGQSQITGMASRLTARKIVAFINNGPLPVPLHIVSTG